MLGRSITIKKGTEARQKGLTDEPSRERVTEIRDRILAGEDFGELAEGSSEDMSHDVEDYYDQIDTKKVQNLAYEKTFTAWTGADWDDFDKFFLKYVEKL